MEDLVESDNILLSGAMAILECSLLTPKIRNTLLYVQFTWFFTSIRGLCI